jgi:hypothetical protein
LVGFYTVMLQTQGFQYFIDFSDPDFHNNNMKFTSETVSRAGQTGFGPEPCVTRFVRVTERGIAENAFNFYRMISFNITSFMKFVFNSYKVNWKIQFKS